MSTLYVFMYFLRKNSEIKSPITWEPDTQKAGPTLCLKGRTQVRFYTK